MQWIEEREKYCGQWQAGLQHGEGEHMWLRQQVRYYDLTIVNRLD